MFVLARAVTYSALFIGFFLIFLPARILSSAMVGSVLRMFCHHCVSVWLTIGSSNAQT